MKYLSYNDLVFINMWCQNMTEGISITEGIKDENLLQSIPEAIKQTFGGEEIYPTIVDKVAYLWEALSKYHCFNDGNKRTALIASLAFLKFNNWDLKMNYAKLFEVSMLLAEGKLEREKLKEYISNNIFLAKNDIQNLIEILTELKNNKELIKVVNKLGQ